jgi:glyoxylase-like metal-dependent hydrolase (beta-lactamase superfamily II)
MSRRAFLRDLGHGACALTVIGLAGCVARPTSSRIPLGSFGRPGTVHPSGSFNPLTYMGNLDEIEAFWCENSTPSGVPFQGAADSAAADQWRWGRIGDTRASAYVIVRGGEATLVDTSPWCTSDVIEAGLRLVGLDWGAVASVIVTHKHPDHWVGLPAALDHAPDAAVYAGAADIPFIASPRAIVPVGAGDRVMDLAIIPTPGHTPGHIAVHDEAAGVLVVGDAVAISPSDGKVLPYGTTEDMQGALASVRTLVGLSFDTFLPGHGDPIIGGAWEALSDYVAESGT